MKPGDEILIRAKLINVRESDNEVTVGFDSTTTAVVPLGAVGECERIWCMQCGKSASTPVPKDTIVRAWVECPECIERGRPKGADVSTLGELVTKWRDWAKEYEGAGVWENHKAVAIVEVLS